MTTKLWTGREGKFERHTDISGLNAVLALSLTGEIRRLLWAQVNWSASVTKDVTITLNSGAGVGWDHLLHTLAVAPGTADIWIPATPILFGPDDSLDLSAEAAGVGETSSLSVYTKLLS